MGKKKTTLTIKMDNFLVDHVDKLNNMIEDIKKNSVGNEYAYGLDKLINASSFFTNYLMKLMFNKPVKSTENANKTPLFTVSNEIKGGLDANKKNW